MKFWDTSALVPLLVREARTAAVMALLARDAQVLAWWATPVECASAIARMERDGVLAPARAAAAFDRLEALRSSWHEVRPVEDLRSTAVRFLRVHPLRAADALQLAAAFLAAEAHPQTLEFVCLDGRLADVARREGFKVVAIG